MMHLQSSTLETLLERVQKIVADVTKPNAKAVDHQARWPEESIRALQEASLGGLVIPVEAGGQGQGLRAVARVCEELATGCASTALCFGMHCVGAACLAAKASSVQQKMWLEPIAAGEHLTTLALSEPGTGAHFYLPQTELLEFDDHFVLRGTKSFVTNGDHADSYVVSTRATDEEVSPGAFSLVAVPADTEGIEWQPPWRGMGMRGNAARTMDLRDIQLPRHNLLGSEGDQLWYVFEVVVPSFVIAMSGTYLGIATSAVEQARDHLKERRYSFGGTAPSKTSIVQRELGILWRRVESTRRLLYYAADAATSGNEEALMALFSAKADVARCVVDVVNGALSLVGGKGFAARSPLERSLRDARAADVMAPTTQILETWIGRTLLDLPLLME